MEKLNNTNVHIQVKHEVRVPECATSIFEVEQVEISLQDLSTELESILVLNMEFPRRRRRYRKPSSNGHNC